MSAAQSAEPRVPAWRRVDLKVIGPIVALVLILLLGMLLSDRFLSWANLSNVLSRSAFIGVIAVGATFVIASGGIDLSVGSMAAFVAGMMIVILNLLMGTFGISVTTVVLGMLAGLVIGLLAGSLNGALITKAGIEPFIVTLGTLGIFRSLMTYAADGGTLRLDSGLQRLYGPVYSSGILGISWPIIVFAIVAILGQIVMTRTAFGRHCSAIGSNEQVARYSAIRVDRVKMLTYVIQGICVAVATLLYVPRLGSAQPSTGIGWELEAIAAVIIGGTLLKGGYGRVWGTVIGVLILGFIANILNINNIGLSEYLNGAIQGVIIVAAVLLQRGRRTT
jgi:ribose transport system permease protein